MGTKIEHAFDPLVPTATGRKKNKLIKNLQYQVDDWRNLQARKSNKFQKSTTSDSMEGMLEEHNTASIRNTMQIHEHIFKHQVHELHRLYSVQKRLMGELKKESNQNPRIRSSSSTEMNRSHPQFINNSSYHHHHHHHHLRATTQTANSSGYILHFQDVIQTDARERSGSCSGETIMKNKARAGSGFDLERPAAVTTSANTMNMDDQEHAAGPSNQMTSINKNGSDGDDNAEDSEIELTLSIGVGPSSNRNDKKNKSKGHHQLGFLDSQASFKFEGGGGGGGGDSSCPNTPSLTSSSATTTTTTSTRFDQEKKMPRWLFGLSINRS